MLDVYDVLTRKATKLNFEAELAYLDISYHNSNQCFM